jgi:uncharacterized membrane protein YvbJ
MKKCPFCAEEIQEEAVKCKHCGEFLIDAELKQMRRSQKDTAKWYHRTPFVVMSILCVGPFALPLVWFNPHYNAVTKAVVTISVIALTVVLSIGSVAMYAHLMEQIEKMGL